MPGVLKRLDEPEPPQIAVRRLHQAETDKPWKAQSARRMRRAARQALGYTADGDALPAKQWALTNPWHGLKDGKHRLANPSWRDLRK